MLDTLIEWDRELFLYLNGLGNAKWDFFWQFVTNKYSSIPLYVLLLILSYLKYGTKKTFVLLLFAIMMVTLTDQLANFFKNGVERLRPCHDTTLQPFMRLVRSTCGGQYAYFSAHASNAFAIAIFFGRLLRGEIRYLPLGLCLWACMVGYSRIYVGVHFPLDVVTGALIGALLGWVFSKLYIFALRKFSL